LPDASDPRAQANNFCLDQPIHPNFIFSDLVNVKPFSPLTFDKFITVSEQELPMFVLNSPCKSCGLDPWSTFLIKNFDIIPSSLTKLVNMSLFQGIFPTCFNNSPFTPLKNSLDKDGIIKYCPISGLSFISKHVGSVVVSQMKTHCKDSK
jgi:hypothetical protein